MRFKKLKIAPISIGDGMVIRESDLDDERCFTVSNPTNKQRNKLNSFVRLGWIREVETQAVKEVASVETQAQDNAWITMNAEELAEAYTVAQLTDIAKDMLFLEVPSRIKQADLVAMIISERDGEES